MDLESECSTLEYEGNNREELSPNQIRKCIALKKWKRIRRDPNSSRISSCDSDSGYLLGPDSENNEGWSIIARAPKVRHVRENWKNNLDNWVQLEERQIEGSIECDSRNVNSNWECSVSSNEGNSDGNLCWHVEEEEKEERSFEDPLIESVRSLRAVQEALEQEIKKFEEIGNESFDDDNSTKCSSAAPKESFVGLESHKSCLSGHSSKQIPSSSLELKVLSLTENINILESKSEELQGILALKDSRIAELEKIALTGDKFKFHVEESTCNIGILGEKFKEVESELESLFRQKVEAEVVHLAITKMMQNLKVASAFTLLKKQETMSDKQVQVPNKLDENRAGELEKYCGDILGVEETFMVQKRVSKLTFCLFLQFMLLILVFWLVVSQLVPNSEVFVPT